MKTHEFLSFLEQHKNKSLLFEYAPNAFVGHNYHITEVKHIHIDSVDCGAQADTWNETVIQLWESPQERDTKDAMSVYKAMGILNKVARIKSFDLEAEIKFEYGNTTFHTAQLFVNDFEIQGDHLIIKLAVQKTDCKAKEACGIAEPEAIAAGKAEPCCEPGGNCC
ncbi:DUF6428 family protein [Gaetbulibacter aestuarii]|uniref:DUF6428 family protein n=1 Tax=Gaetbulibacter aestuarii TaxID=1502358 RepID=A0ABW7MZ02_9FLAO